MNKAITSINKSNVFLIGYYGFANVGDDVLLKNSILLLRNRFIDCQISVLTKDDKALDVLGAFLDSVSLCLRKKLGQMLSIFYHSDIVVFGGGGLFQDSTSICSMLYYGGLFFLAKLFRKKVYLLAQGLGPFNHKISQLLMTMMLRLSTGVSVREAFQFEFVKKYQRNVQYGSDLAYFQATPGLFLAGDSMIGLNIRSCGDSAQLALALQGFFNHIKQPIVFIDCFNGKDFQQFKTMFNEADQRCDVIHLSNYFLSNQPFPYSLQIHIGMRYHSLVYASLYYCPFVAIVYDPKVKALAEQLGQVYVHLSDLYQQPELLFDAYQKVMDRYDQYVARLKRAVPIMIKDAERHQAIF